jgi:hypothetical protein
MGLTKDLGALPRAITVDSSNRVGIGNVPPSQKFEVSGVTKISPVTPSSSGVATLLLSNAFDNDNAITHTTDKALGFLINGTERMRIASSGNLIIGPPSTDNGSKLAIFLPSSVNNTPGLDITNQTNASFRVSLRNNITEIAAGGTGNLTFFNSAERMRISSNGNVGIATNNPRTTFHNNGTFLIGVGAQYGEAKSFIFQSAFNNPTIDLMTINSTSTFGAVIIRVTIYHNTVSTGLCNISVGYAQWAASAYPTIIKNVINPVIQASFGGGINVGSLSWSGDTLRYTSNRMTNFDGYTVVVEWGGNPDVNAAPSYGPNI